MRRRPNSQPEGKFTINFGPQHPAAHGVLRLVLELDGEIVDARRSAYRPAASRHRKADRAQDLSAGDPLFRPARLCRADEPGARLLPRHREAARHRGAARGQSDPRAVLRDRPAAVASAQRHHAGDGRRRADAAAVGLRRARKADGVLRARLAARACTRPISAPAACIRTCRRSCSTTSTSSAIRSRKVLDDIEGLLTDNRIFKQRNVDIGVVTLEDA